MDAFVIEDRGATKEIVVTGNWCLRFSEKDVEECGYKKGDIIYIIAERNSIKLYNWEDNNDHRRPCQAVLGCKDSKLLPPPMERSDLTADKYVTPPGGLRYLPLVKNNEDFFGAPIPVGTLSTDDLGGQNSCRVNLHQIQLHYE